MTSKRLSALVMQSGDVPRTAELMQMAEASISTLACGKRANEDGVEHEVDNRWQTWSKGEKIGVVVAAVLVAVTVMVVLGAVKFVNRKRRVQKKKKKEAALEEGNRKRGKKGKKREKDRHTRRPRDIKVMETVRNGPSALKSNQGNPRARTRQGTSSHAAEPLMSGALQGDQNAPKGKRPLLLPTGEREINFGRGEEASRRTHQIRQSHGRKKDTGRGSDEGGL